MGASDGGLVEQILRRLGELRFKNLAVITAALLLIDLAVPDFVPFIDEILLGILTMMFWSWRRPETRPRVIDGDSGEDRS